MKKIFIFGAGSGSQEVLLAIEQINQLTPTWEVLGFIEKSPELIGTEINGYSVYSLENIDLKPITPVHGVCGVLDSKIRQRIIKEEIEGNNISLATIIHPSSVVPKGCLIGKGSIIMPFVKISYDVIIGKGVFVLWNSLLGHNLRVDDYSTILSSANITGGCSIGERTIIGAGATININVTIGNDCIVGVGTTVLRNVENNKTIVSLPRQIINDRA